MKHYIPSITNYSNAFNKISFKVISVLLEFDDDIVFDGTAFTD